jgi:hypothetical protein
MKIMSEKNYNIFYAWNKTISETFCMLIQNSQGKYCRGLASKIAPNYFGQYRNLVWTRDKKIHYVKHENAKDRQNYT